MSERRYLLLGREVGPETWQAFKARLVVAQTSVDERLPALRTGGRGGNGALWKAKDPQTGRLYVVNEYVLEGEAVFLIDLEAA